MTAAFVQGAGSSANWNGINTTTTFFTFASAVGAAGFAHGHIIFDGGLLGATLLKITDDKLNLTYALGTPITVPSGGDAGFTLQTFRGWNLTGGPTILTATLTAASDFTAIEGAEYSGVQSSSDPLDVQEGLWQDNLSAGTNALFSSTTGTLTNAADLIIGNLCDIDEHIIAVTAGTSPQAFAMDHTQQSPAPASLLYIESYVQAAAAAARATFTNSTTSFNTIAIMTAYKQAGGVAAPLFRRAGNTGRTGSRPLMAA